MPNWLRVYLLGIAQQVIAKRQPDVVIGDNYMQRWHLCRSKLLGIYVHRVMHDDDDGALHDHRSFTLSVLLEGEYREEMPYSNMPYHDHAGQRISRFLQRYEGQLVLRSPWALHRLVMGKGKPVITLFIIGPHLRNWGFQCPRGWVPWQQYIGEGNYGSRNGPGCN